MDVIKELEIIETKVESNTIDDDYIGSLDELCEWLPELLDYIANSCNANKGKKNDQLSLIGNIKEEILKSNMWLRKMYRFLADLEYERVFIGGKNYFYELTTLLNKAKTFVIGKSKPKKDFEHEKISAESNIDDFIRDIPEIIGQLNSPVSTNAVKDIRDLIYRLEEEEIVRSLENNK